MGSMPKKSHLILKSAQAWPRNLRNGCPLKAHVGKKCYEYAPLSKKYSPINRRTHFSGKNSTLWPWRPGLESQQPHTSLFYLFYSSKAWDSWPNYLGIFIFALVVAYHLVIADPKYEANN
ncbi:oligosaccaryltransferase [Medicago truncatula]|uniref:Oligosaccaryltransferase n=1 Tax=Medicago truncatula TaxID=3880 RepID=G7IPN0_MEDTR|nr:oligosaccaryltransferase [Medicago truncatula]